MPFLLNLFSNLVIVLSEIFGESCINECLILDEIKGSDHCPIMLELNYQYYCKNQIKKSETITDESKNMFDMKDMCSKK